MGKAWIAASECGALPAISIDSKSKHLSSRQMINLDLNNG